MPSPIWCSCSVDGERGKPSFTTIRGPVKVLLASPPVLEGILSMGMPEAKMGMRDGEI